MRFIAGVMIWLSLALTIALLAVSSVYTWMKYSELEDVPNADGSIWNVNPMYQVTFPPLIMSALSSSLSGVGCLPQVERHLAGALRHQCQLVHHHSPHHHLPPQKAQDCDCPHLGGLQGGREHHEQRLLPHLLLPAAAGRGVLVGCRLHVPRLLHGQAVHNEVSGLNWKLFWPG